MNWLGWITEPGEELALLYSMGWNPKVVTAQQLIVSL